MRAKDFDIQKIIHTCQGTCTESIQSAIEYHYPEMSEDDLTDNDYNDIDNEIFLCSICGWWCETCELSEINIDENTCTDHDDE